MRRCCSCSNRSKMEKMRKEIDELRYTQESNDLGILSAQSVSDLYTPKTHIVEKRTGLGLLSYVLMMGIVLLAIATMFISSVVKNSTRDFVVQDRYQDRLVEVEVERDTTDYEYRSRVSKMESKIKAMEHKQWKLSIAVNENANLAQRMDDQFHYCHPHTGYIKFDKNWNLNKYPSTMSMTQEQMNLLEVR